jgi:16S rRNA U516 pseudouridylate synthase RsuA-like enzyme
VSTLGQILIPGLLLLTNDGELAQRLMHPRYGVNKVYHAKLSSCPTADDWAQLRRGFEAMALPLCRGGCRSKEKRLD